MEKTVRRLTTPEELFAMDKIATISYVNARDLEEQFQKRMAQKDIPLPQDVWGAFGADGNLCAALFNNNYTVEFDGHGVSASGIGGVCSLPEFRSKGSVRALFREVLQEAHREGCVFSYLFPFSYPYYRKFGYELLHTEDHYEIPIEALHHFSCSYEVRMCQTEGTTTEMHQVYSQFLKGNNLSIHREDRHWKIAQGDPYKNRCYKYTFFDPDGHPRAYIIFTPGQSKTDGSRIISVNDLAYTSAQDLSHILGFLYRFQGQYSAVNLILPEDVPLVSMFPNNRSVKHTRHPHGQLRVVNVSKALEAMRCPAEPGSVVIAIEDAFLPENTSNYLLAFADGKATKVEWVNQQQPDIRLSIERFSQMVTGSISFAQAAFLPDVTVFRNHSVLEKLFIRKKIYFRDGF